MRVSTQPKPDPTAFDAFASSLRAWLAALLIWLIDVLERHSGPAPSPALRAALAAAKRRVAADLRQGARGLKALLAAHAYVRTPIPPPRQPGPRHPRPIPPGFRRAQRRNTALRVVIGQTLAGIHAGSLRQRAERLACLLDNLEPLIARVAARLARLLRGAPDASFILIAARDALVSIAAAPPPRADTS